MKPLHPQAMPVILDSPESQKLWLLEGDRDLLIPYTGKMISEQMHDTLEQLYPEENQPPKHKENVDLAGRTEEEQGSLF